VTLGGKEKAKTGKATEPRAYASRTIALRHPLNQGGWAGSREVGGGGSWGTARPAFGIRFSPIQKRVGGISSPGGEGNLKGTFGRAFLNTTARFEG